MNSTLTRPVWGPDQAICSRSSDRLSPSRSITDGSERGQTFTRKKLTPTAERTLTRSRKPCRRGVAVPGHFFVHPHDVVGISPVSATRCIENLADATSTRPPTRGRPSSHRTGRGCRASGGAGCPTTTGRRPRTGFGSKGASLSRRYSPSKSVRSWDSRSRRAVSVSSTAPTRSRRRRKRDAVCLVLSLVPGRANPEQ